MASLTSDSGCSPGGRYRSNGHFAGSAPFLALMLCLAALVALPGCGGCRKTPQQLQAEREKMEAERRAKERERKKKKKPDLEMGRLISLPHGPNPDFCTYKPGHWNAAAMPAKANNADLLGDLKVGVVDARGRPVGLLGMGYSSTGSRQVTLPKGQAKLLQSVLYVPRSGRNVFASGRIDARARKGGRVAGQKAHPLKRMPSYQYHFVVLAQWPVNLNYKYLEGLDSVKHPSALDSGDSDSDFYRVHLVGADAQAVLPSYGLFWTSIAYVLWDDALADAILPDQQVALLDWLHWGGQLIISGPDSLDSLGTSFLAPYLPATSAGSRELSGADFDGLNDRFTLPVHGRPGRRLVPAAPWAGVVFDLHADAREVPGTGALLVERRVGRGRIVVSAFELDQRELTDWPGYDGFFNACLLGRPPRRFEGPESDVQVTWTESGFGPFDPRAVSKLRYFARDTGKKEADPREPGGMAYGGYGGGVGSLGYTGEDAQRMYGPDVASWSDFNSVANSARQSLQNAARIEIPKREFVLWVLGAYLLILVPANWLVFRAIGRVEWAWAAAPVIAIVYTVVVIRMAQLDIGFARSLTEIAVVEVQGDYPRAHVTRYTALYTSLATGYEFRCEGRGALVQPFPSARRPEDFRLLPGQGLTELEYRYDWDVRMRGFHATSNTTGLVHSEQMVDLGGAIALRATPGSRYRITNGSEFTLRGAGVIRRNGSDQLETAWIGELEPGATADLRFQVQAETKDSAAQLWASQRDRSPLTLAATAKGGLGLRPLVKLAEQPQTLEAGDARLVGWLDEEVPGLDVKPAAPQSRRAALVVAHLRYGYGKDPQPDANTRREQQTDPYRTVPDPSQAETR